MNARQAEDFAYFEEHWPPFAVLLRYLSGDAAISAEDARLQIAQLSLDLRLTDQRVERLEGHLSAIRTICDQLPDNSGEITSENARFVIESINYIHAHTVWPTPQETATDGLLTPRYCSQCGQGYMTDGIHYFPMSPDGGWFDDDWDTCVHCGVLMDDGWIAALLVKPLAQAARDDAE